MPQRASVFCNFYIRVDQEALVSERALDVGSVAFKAMSTKKDLFENLPACCYFKNLPDCNKMFSLVLNFQQSGRAFELCSFCEINSEQ
jgi:hypothetical protein